MLEKIYRRFRRPWHNFQFRIFASLLRSHGIAFIFRDPLGILTRREPTDNFAVIFSTGYSCDAVPMMLALSSKVKGSDIAFDVGANIGITTTWLARNSRHVYAFEPEPGNLLRQAETLGLNQVKNVTTVPCAVSDQTGTLSLHIYESYGHHSLSPAHHKRPVGCLSIQTTTLDIFCQERSITQIDVLKIDVEGFELEVLRGARTLLSEHKIYLIIFEHSKTLLEIQKRDPCAVFQFLLEYNYSIFDLNGRKLTKESLLHLADQDIYALPVETPA